MGVNSQMINLTSFRCACQPGSAFVRLIMDRGRPAFYHVAYALNAG